MSFKTIFVILTLMLPLIAKSELGPIVIYLNTEYRTQNPIINPIASTIKLGKKEIAQSGANTFLELLATIPALNLEAAQGNVAAIRIRGNSARHVLVLVDGVKVEQFGQANLDVIPLDQIKRIEIIKGPFSSLYGSGAIGGVVHIFTDAKEDNKEQNKISLSYGTHNSKKINIHSSFKNHNNYISYNLSNYHTNGINARYDINQPDLDSTDRMTASLNIGAKLSDITNVRFKILSTNATIKYDGYYEDSSEKNLKQITMNIDHEFNNAITSKLSYAMNKQLLYANEYKTTDITLLNDIKLKNSLLILGLTKQKDEKKSTKNSNTDIFGQWQGFVSNNEVSAGLRHMNHNRFNKYLSYNFNFAKDLANDYRLSISYGKSIKLPALYQTETNIKPATATHLANNHNELLPERSASIELGIQKKYPWGLIVAKVYKSKIADFFKYNVETCLTGTYQSSIYPNPASCSDNSLIAAEYYSNSTKQHNTKGVDLSIETQLLTWNISAEYNYNSSIAEPTNYQIGRLPKQSIGITASKKHNKFNHRISLISKSSAWDTNDGQNKLGGYTLLNLSSNYAYNKNTLIGIKINNTLDKKYQLAKGYNQLGHTISLEISRSF